VALGTAGIFESVHLKGGLGALALGVILANTDKAKELYVSLINLKDLFLIGFFLEIGYYGLPASHMIYVAFALALIIFVRPPLYYLLFVTFRLRARTALLASLALFNYSEFGLIVAAIASAHGILPMEWVTTLALALSISFFVATPFNTGAHGIYNRYSDWLHRFERRGRLPEERPARLGTAEVVVLGMGRVGQGAYAYLKDRFPGNIVGVDENLEKVMQHRAAGINCVHADASDLDFWEDVDVHHRKLILVSLTNHSENLTVVDLARKFNFMNDLAVVSRYPDEQAELLALGCIAFNLYGEAGHGFAEHVINEIENPRVAG
jgi:glutathione-regulated potassium-efflux system ancillary protein KefC